MTNYHIEITDTYGGEANYSWVTRYTILANSTHGALCKLAKQYGSGWRLDFDTGGVARYNLKNAAICLFINQVDDN
jgi:hypothetical protein